VSKAVALLRTGWSGPDAAALLWPDGRASPQGRAAWLRFSRSAQPATTVAVHCGLKRYAPGFGSNEAEMFRKRQVPPLRRSNQRAPCCVAWSTGTMSDERSDDGSSRGRRHRVSKKFEQPRRAIAADRLRAVVGIRRIERIPGSGRDARLRDGTRRQGATGLRNGDATRDRSYDTSLGAGGSDVGLRGAERLQFFRQQSVGAIEARTDRADGAPQALSCFGVGEFAEIA